MKRQRPDKYFAFDYPAGPVHEVFTRSQLAEVGAVILAWNHLELVLDQVAGMGLDLPELMRPEVIGRLHGIDGKIAIIRLAASERCLALSSAIRKRIDSTMSVVGECKTYRDAVAHARAVRRTSGPIVESTGARGKMFDLLFTPEALALLTRRIEAVTKELGDINMVFNFQAGIMNLWDVNSNGGFDHDIKLFGADVQRYAAQLRRHQKRRLSLPPLPAFPKAPPTPQE